ncbi:MAG: UbiA-like protein EboC [Oculatellaceae cyanobacterium Prado106]|jgi:4-hydroxybenzoate polyprenyltransferase|nr:UbiA-like protein EboC [Oculatellaceae cyanobacterium Prado106]
MNTANLSGRRWWAYLQLMRPANIVTAWADILVGCAISGIITTTIPGESLSLSWQVPLLLPSLESLPVNLPYLLLATTGLYGGGVVLNDLCDAAIDTQERPERPIPSQRASMSGAMILASSLFAIGIAAAAQVTLLSTVIAICIAVAAGVYNAIAKHHTLWGPLNMGLCRGGNWLLGVSLVPNMVTERGWMALIPLLYIAAITAISQGEVWGGHKRTGAIALALLGIVFSSVLALAMLSNFYLLAALPFVLLFAVRVLPPFIQTAREPVPDRIRKAVKTGVLSLILLDAAVASGFAGVGYGAIVLLLLPLSMALAQLFAVT